MPGPSGKPNAYPSGPTPSGIPARTTERSREYGITTGQAQYVVTASNADGEEDSTGINQINRTVMHVKNVAGTNVAVWSGFRFAGVAIEKAAAIATSTMQLWISTVAKGNILDVTVYAEAADSGAVFSTTASSISSRARTTASVTWTTSGLIDEAYTASPDLSAVIQEVVNRAGWVSGNPINILLNARSTNATGILPWDTGRSYTVPGLHIAVGPTTITAAENFPAFTEAGTLAAAVTDTAAETFPIFTEAGTLGVTVTNTAAETFPIFTEAGTFGVTATSTAAELFPVFTEADTLGVAVTNTAAEVFPAFTEAGDLTVASNDVNVTTAETFPAFTPEAGDLAVAVTNTAAELFPAFTEAANIAAEGTVTSAETFPVVSESADLFHGDPVTTTSDELLPSLTEAAELTNAVTAAAAETFPSLAEAVSIFHADPTITTAESFPTLVESTVFSGVEPPWVWRGYSRLAPHRSDGSDSAEPISVGVSAEGAMSGANSASAEAIPDSESADREHGGSPYSEVPPQDWDGYSTER